MIAPVLGQTASRRGDITTNTWVGARSARALESSLGFGSGRLNAGWWILVLKKPLTADDFIFSGTTLRSGGRLGLPTDDSRTDRLRPHVDEVMVQEQGERSVRTLRERMLTRVSYQGPDRLVKVVPVTGHSDSMRPDLQYPMGGGGLQWTLIRNVEFFVAVQVEASGIARTPNFSVNLSAHAAYADRAKLARYIEGA